MITPFIGARLHCWCSGYMTYVTGVKDDGTQPCIGIVVNVQDDRTVDVQLISPMGIGGVWNTVQLVQPEDEAPVLEEGLYATWIPGAN